MERDHGAAPFRLGFGGEGIQALQRHIQLAVAVLPHLSNLDAPGWRLAHDEYERSWDAVCPTFEGTAKAPVEDG